MRDTYSGWRIRLDFLCIFLVTLAHKCLGGGNLTTPSCSEQERLALLMFKHSVKEDHGMLSSWGLGIDCCKWAGVDCDVTGSVVSLHLRGYVREASYLQPKYMYLYQDYPPLYANEDHHLVADEVSSCLTNLVNLKHLDLSGNDFRQSRIPEFIGSLKQLRYLNLSKAGFSGNIPHQIGNLSNLKALDVSSQFINDQWMTNDIEWISGLSKLEHLSLSRVNLSRVQNLDKVLYMIPSLSKLILSDCRLHMAQLSSHHLNSSRELASIKHMDLSGNDFRGHLHGLFLNMTSLAFLDLSWNNFGMPWSFEKFLTTIPHVSELRLAFCSIENINFSPISYNFSKYSNIQHLDLRGNEIEGMFPSILINMSSLLSLDLSGNKFSSFIPVMPNLLKLDISVNNLRQIEDVGIWEQCHLKELIVTHNELEGKMIGPSTNVSKCSQNALEILYLSNNRLNGSIPESFGRLTDLIELDLSFNDFTGPIPEALGKLRSLQRLDLSKNQLISSIPESLGRLTTLTEMYMNSNRFTGSIPASLGRLTSLKTLSLSSNLLNGTIPSSIGKLTKLHLIDISDNSLKGVVSEDHFANLRMLKYLIANSNDKLQFNISSEWIPPFQLKVARLGSCKIEGGFPQWFQTQRKLEELVLSNASIVGPLPTWLRLLPNMPILDLSHNKLTGPLMNLPSVSINYSAGQLHLQDNLFTGFSSRWLCKMTYLKVLDISRNRLTGRIPECVWNLPLKAMLLSSNRLSGVIPSSLGRISSLVWLQLNDNNLKGELPRDLGHFMNLAVLDLGGNKISGSIPEWIGENVTRLFAFRLHRNRFIGRIPHSLCKCDYLQVLDLAHNNLTESIPHCFGELIGMQELSYDTVTTTDFWYGGDIMQVLKGSELDYTEQLSLLKNMDLSSNKLDGEIPESLTILTTLVGLNLSYNHLSGGIPNEIGSMKSLNSLDLSSNELTGMIPSSMASLNFLSHLNLSHNNLSGQIPTGNQLQTLTDPSVYFYNPYLCGAPLPKKCSSHENPRTTTRYENAKKPNKVLFYMDITCGFATGFWGIIGVLVFKKQWRHKLFMFCEATMDKIYVAVAVKVSKMKRGRESA